MEGAPRDAEAMEKEGNTVEGDVEGKLCGGCDELGDESLEGG